MESSVFVGQKSMTISIVGLIAAVFIACGGFAYWGFTSTGATGRYGSVGIPGQSVVLLPTGVNGVTYAPVGTLRVADAGKYRVDVTGSAPGAPNPQLLFGIGSQHTGILIGSLVIAGLLLLMTAVLSILRKRARRRTPLDFLVG